MRVLLLGAGNAGSKVVDQAVAYQQQTSRHFIVDALAINSARTDLRAIDTIPDENQLIIGQSQVWGKGAGADNTVGKEIAEHDIHQVMSALGSVPIHDIDAFIIATSLGGGTGSGAAPVIADQLKQEYEEPVYGLGILPARNEGGRYQLNTARSLPTFQSSVDNLILFDNEVWRSGGDISEGYATANREIVERFVALFGAGEEDGSATAENIVDSSEIINTLSCGGISAIGHAETRVQSEKSKGLLGSLRNGDQVTEQQTESEILGLVKSATTANKTLPCTVSSTTKALCLISGPQAAISRSGVENSRRWLEQQTDSRDVRGGDDPRETPTLAGLVLLSGVVESERVTQLQAQASEAHESMEELETAVDDATEDLVNSDLDAL